MPCFVLAEAKCLGCLPEGMQDTAGVGGTVPVLLSQGLLPFGTQL